MKTLRLVLLFALLAGCASTEGGGSAPRSDGSVQRPDPDTGVVAEMHWATYRFTRTQLTFDGMNPGEP